MAIDIGAEITSITQIEQNYVINDPPETKTLVIRNVVFRVVGMPVPVPPTFTLAVTDATQWNTLQVGRTYTVSIAEV